MRPDRPVAGVEPADPNASTPSHAQVRGGADSAAVRLVAEPADPNAPAEPADAHTEPEPDTLTGTLGVVAEAPGRPAAQPSAPIALPTPASAFSRYQVVAVADSWEARADEILRKDPFTEPDGESPPPIWGAFRELVESTVDAPERESVLRAGWLALRGEIGEGA